MLQMGKLNPRGMEGGMEEAGEAGKERERFTHLKAVSDSARI